MDSSDLRCAWDVPSLTLAISSFAFARSKRFCTCQTLTKRKQSASAACCKNMRYWSLFSIGVPWPLRACGNTRTVSVCRAPPICSAQYPKPGRWRQQPHHFAARGSGTRDRSCSVTRGGAAGSGMAGLSPNAQGVPAGLTASGTPKRVGGLCSVTSCARAARVNSASRSGVTIC